MGQQQPPAPLGAVDLAMRLLARRDYSSAALHEKLVRLGVPPLDASAALERVEELGYVNDKRLAGAVVRTRTAMSRWGKSRILLDLRKRGVPDDVANAALAELEEQSPEEVFGGADVSADERGGGAHRGHVWRDAASDALRRKYGAWDVLEPKERQRRVAFLVRRGFSYDEALHALDTTRRGPET